MGRMGPVSQVKSYPFRWGEGYSIYLVRGTEWNRLRRKKKSWRPGVQTVKGGAAFDAGGGVRGREKRSRGAGGNAV